MYHNGYGPLPVGLSLQIVTQMGENVQRAEEKREKA